MAWNLLRVLYMWLATVCQIKEKKKVGEFKEEMDFTEVKWSDDKVNIKSQMMNFGLKQKVFGDRVVISGQILVGFVCYCVC